MNKFAIFDNCDNLALVNGRSRDKQVRQTLTVLIREKCRPGGMSKAARYLGVSCSTIRRHLEEGGLTLGEFEELCSLLDVPPDKFYSNPSDFVYVIGMTSRCEMALAVTR